MTTERKHDITSSSGNVFADLGFNEQEAANLKIRAELMVALDQWIHQNRLKQREAAEILGISQSRVSDLLRGKVHKFSIDTLVNLLALTKQDVKVKVRAS